MPDAAFRELERRLQEAGIAGRYVRRTVTELQDHHTDLVASGRQSGLSEEAARIQADEQLGQLEAIAAAVIADPGARSWAYRYPRLASVAYPMAWCVLLPAVPLYAGIQQAPVLARWFACGVLGAAVTAIMLLLLQLSITLT